MTVWMVGLVMSSIGVRLRPIGIAVSAAGAASMLMTLVEVKTLAVRQTALGLITIGAVAAVDGEEKVYLRWVNWAQLIHETHLQAPCRQPSDRELGGGMKHIPGKSVS